MTCNWTPILNPFDGRLQIIGQTTGGSGVVAPVVSVLKKQALADLASASKSTVLTYTAPSDINITKIIAEGEDYAQWFLTLDTVDQNIRPTGPDRDKVWTFENPWKLNSGQVLDIKVIHHNTGEQLDFSATIWGYV